MGLGKTIEALALIIAHRAPDAEPKTTLIVAPLALLKQWDREIADKIRPAYKLSTFLYHGRLKKTRKASQLSKFDIVITTYETVAWEYKNFLENRRRITSQLFGPGNKFHRIILDEAHKIKNRAAVCSTAVAELDAKYRLCMTGTVFMNRTAEIFALIRFLRIKPYDDWMRFNEDIERPLRHWVEDEQAEGMRKLQVLFRSITLRRTKDSQLDGKPIITLPELTITSELAVFNDDERAYYDALERKQQIRFNKYLKQGSLSKVYTFILVLLLRLRQACCHPFLIKDHGIPDEAQLDGKQMVQLAMKLDRGIVDRILKKTRFQCPICDDTAEIPMIIYPCGHDICSTCFSSMMQVVLDTKNNADQRQLFGAAEDEMEATCPHGDCGTEIHPKKVICHNFFLDAHSSEGGSQNDLDNGGMEDDEDCCSDEDTREDTDDDEGSLRNFIAPDGDESGDGMGDDGVDDEECGSRPNCTSPAVVWISSDDDEGDDAGRTSKHKGTLAGNGTDASRSAVDEMWDDIFARHREPKETQKNLDSDSDDSLVSIIDLTTVPELEKAQGSEDVDIFQRAAMKRKRSVSSKTLSTPKKRVNIEDKDAGTRTANKADRKPKKVEKKAKHKELTMGQLRKAASGSKAARAKYLERLRKDFESSAKIDVTLDLLRSIRADKPGEKTLVFSLWTSFLDLLEIPLRDAGFRYLRYDGGMTFDERDESVRRFSAEGRGSGPGTGGVDVLLVSLMAGNAGLNLTAASQVVVLEPFWNPFVEDQAVDRTHRIGQRRRVEVHRVLVGGTVEDRILELQEKKRRLVGAALSEEGAIGAGRLSIGELKGLFGLR